MNARVRLSPDEMVAAIQHKPGAPWVGTDGFEYSDKQVEDWIRLKPRDVSPRVTCPWCHRSRRALTREGRLWQHRVDPLIPGDCEGTGHLPSDYAAVQAKGSAA